MTYHVAKIPRGVFGDSSKILEEVLELQDAEAQGVTIMALCELSDIIGAVEGYLEKHHPHCSLQDLIKMKDVTRRAFASGHRAEKPVAEKPNQPWSMLDAATRPSVGASSRLADRT